MNIHEALIIGGSSGIGKAVANRLLQRQLTVTLVARNAQKFNSIMEELSTRGQVNSRTVDLYDPDAVANLC
jgi:short-subunit dehydrogenase